MGFRVYGFGTQGLKFRIQGFVVKNLESSLRKNPKTYDLKILRGTSIPKTRSFFNPKHVELDQ